MTPIKVVHMITRLELGGAQQNTLYTAANLDPDRFIVWLVAGAGGELYPAAAALPRFVCAPSLVRPVAPPSDLRALGQLTAIVRQVAATPPADAPVLVHTHSSKAGILGRWAARRAGADAIVHSIHGYGFNAWQPWPVRQVYIGLERITARITDRYIAVSAANARTGIDLGLFAEPDVEVIRSGFDLQEFAQPPADRAAVRRDLDIPPDAPLVTMVACLKPQKHPELFVEVCRRTAARHPRAWFLLVGDGALRAAVLAAVQQAGIGDRFRLAGWRRDVPAIMHASTLLVLTSRWEGLPRVIPQAMAAGVPVVATRVDGTPEAIDAGRTGLLAEPDDAGGLAAAVDRLLADPQLRSRMGDEARHQVRAFDCRQMVRQQEQLYVRLVAGA